MPRPKRPRPVEELRSFQFPTWVMLVWMGWLLAVSPLLLAALNWAGVAWFFLIVWVPATVILFIRTWGRHGKRVSPGDDADGT